MPDSMEPGARVSERWSSGRGARLDLRTAPASTEEPMTDDRMALVELLQKSGEGDFLRSVAEAVLQILMEADVEGLIGAGRHERSAERLNYRNGYRERSLDTRLRSVALGGEGHAVRRLRPAQAVMPKICCTKDRCAGMSPRGTARTCPLARIAIASMPASVRCAVQKP